MIRAAKDVTLKNTRVVGTLVVICPGKTVTIAGPLNIEAARPDYPALIVVGDLSIDAVNDDVLAKSTTGVNFNPAGVPYGGVENATKTDQYPSQITGLVHVTGKVTTKSGPVVNGMLLVESGAAAAALKISDNLTVRLKSSLFDAPPQGYTTRVRMVVQAGSTKQLVN